MTHHPPPPYPGRVSGYASEWVKPIDRRGDSGAAVVAIHGFTGHAGHWIPLADHLHPRGHTVVAPLLPGHGTSPEDLGHTSADDWIEAARGAVGSVDGHDRIHLVGLSMGGLIATVLAAETPVASLTTINAPVRLFERRVRLAPLLHRVVARVDAEVEPVPDPTLDHLWLPYPWYPTTAIAELAGVIHRGLRAARRVDTSSLVVMSRADTVVRPRSGPDLARRLGAELLWLDDARHNTLLDPARSRIHHAVTEVVESAGREGAWVS